MSLWGRHCMNTFVVAEWTAILQKALQCVWLRESVSTYCSCSPAICQSYCYILSARNISLCSENSTVIRRPIYCHCIGIYLIYIHRLWSGLLMLLLTALYESHRLRPVFYYLYMNTRHRLQSLACCVMVREGQLGKTAFSNSSRQIWADTEQYLLWPLK